jgi:ubiquinone/menaquinone biosynthesis C-methylase UbiE
MAKLDWSALAPSAAELYERHIVPGFFRAWAEGLVTLAEVRAGDRVLDVACGTGIVARVAVSRVHPGGEVLGIDASPAMLAAARATAVGLPIEWQEGDVHALALPDGAFDAVLCQQGLQYFRDRVTALREMRRVLAPGGRLALAVFRHSLGHADLARALEPWVGAEAAHLVLEPFRLRAREELEGLLHSAGLEGAMVRATTRHTRIAEPEGFVAFIIASRLGEAVERLDPAARADMYAAASAVLARHVVDGVLAFPMEAHECLVRL